VVVDLLVLNVVVVDLLVVQDVVVDLLVLLDSVVLVVVDQEVGFKVDELVFQLVVVLRFEFHDVVVVVWNLIVRGRLVDLLSSVEGDLYVDQDVIHDEYCDQDVYQ
jgi:hypothetical protein